MQFTFDSFMTLTRLNSERILKSITTQNFGLSSRVLVSSFLECLVTFFTLARFARVSQNGGSSTQDSKNVLKAIHCCYISEVNSLNTTSAANRSHLNRRHL